MQKTCVILEKIPNFEDSASPGTLGFLSYVALLAASKKSEGSTSVAKIPALSPHDSSDRFQWRRKEQEYVLVVECAEL